QWHHIARPGLGAQQLLDVARRLADALFVLDKGQPDILIAIFAKADAGSNANAGFTDQQLGEFERTEMSELRRNRRPGEHGGLGYRNDPARTGKALDHHVTAEFVDLADLLDHIVRAVEGSGGRHLDGGEGTI